MTYENQSGLREVAPMLRERIRSWRAQKDKPRAMPQELWDSAIELAQRFGAHAVAKQLEISYTRLKKLTEESRQAIVQTRAPRLIDVSTSFHSACQSYGVEIELQDTSGRRMCIRNANAMVTHGAVSAFLESGR
jgi:hypothetical protein